MSRFCPLNFICCGLPFNPRIGLHQTVQKRRDVFNLFGDYMTDGLGSLQVPDHTQHAPGDHGAAEPLVYAAPDNDIDHAGFILKRQKYHTFRSPWTLAQDYQSGNRDPRPIGWFRQSCRNQTGWRTRPGGSGFGWTNRHKNKNRTLANFVQTCCPGSQNALARITSLG